MKRNDILATKDILLVSAGAYIQSYLTIQQVGGQTLKKTGMKLFEKHYKIHENDEGETEMGESIPDDNQVIFDLSLDDLEVPEDQLEHDDE